MSKAFQLRAGQSGPVYDGNAGDVLTMQADGTSKFLPGGGGGAIEPLTLDFWVDSGRVGSTQDGSIAQPYLSIQAGIDAIVASGAGRGALLIASGDYSAEELSCPISLSLLATGAPVTVALIGSEAEPAAGGIWFYNVTVAAESFFSGGSRPTRVEGGGLLGAVSITGEPVLEGINAAFGDVTCTDVLGALSFRGCTVNAVIGEEGGFHPATVEAWDTHFQGGIDAEQIDLHVCTVDQSINGTRATLEQSKVEEAHITNTLTVDTFSLMQLRIGASSSEPLQLNITDHPTTLAIKPVPAIEQGSFAEVTISGSGLFAKEGDAVCVSLATDVGTPRLANIGVASAWVEASGDVTIRLFGTTAGGNQLFNIGILPAKP